MKGIQYNITICSIVTFLCVAIIVSVVGIIVLNGRYSTEIIKLYAIILMPMGAFSGISSLVLTIVSLRAGNFPKGKAVLGIIAGVIGIIFFLNTLEIIKTFLF